MLKLLGGASRIFLPMDKALRSEESWMWLSRHWCSFDLEQSSLHKGSRTKVWQLQELSLILMQEVYFCIFRHFYQNPCQDNRWWCILLIWRSNFPSRKVNKAEWSLHYRWKYLLWVINKPFAPAYIPQRQGQNNKRAPIGFSHLHNRLYGWLRSWLRACLATLLVEKLYVPFGCKLLCLNLSYWLKELLLFST